MANSKSKHRGMNRNQAKQLDALYGRSPSKRQSKPKPPAKRSPSRRGGRPKTGR